MTQEQKELLLKDLCARLPYKTQVECSVDSGTAMDVVLQPSHITEFIEGTIIIKPYLRPMSSMTEEEKKYYKEYFRSIEGQLVGMQGRTIWLIDWLNAHHFDYRGLIERGLAIEVTKENNPYKEY